MTLYRLPVFFVLMSVLAAGCSRPETREARNAINAAKRGLPTYRCRSASGPVKIDGLLDDAAWQDAPFSADFIRRRYEVPEMPANVHTRMKMLHDERALYIAVECKDSDIWGTFTELDDPVMFEEAVVIYVDPLGNGRGYYGFYINPLNAMLDLKRPDGSLEMRRRIWRECTRWNGEGIRHAVHVDGTVNKRSDVDNGWTLEMVLPFEALGVRPLAGDQWRVQVGRITRPRMSGIVLSFWAETPMLHVPHYFGVLTFQQ